MFVLATTCLVYFRCSYSPLSIRFSLLLIFDTGYFWVTDSLIKLDHRQIAASLCFTVGLCRVLIYRINYRDSIGVSTHIGIIAIFAWRYVQNTSQ